MPTKTPVALPARSAGAMRRVLQRLPRHLQQQPLLRIHAVGFARRDAEEVRRRTDRPRPGSRRGACTSCRARRDRGRSTRRRPSGPPARPSMASRPSAAGATGRRRPVRPGKRHPDADDRDRLGAGFSSSSRRARIARSSNNASLIGDGWLRIVTHAPARVRAHGRAARAPRPTVVRPVRRSCPHSVRVSFGGGDGRCGDRRHGQAEHLAAR